MKAKFIALAALVLGLASCQQDFDAPVQMGGEVDFQLSVAANELAGTRAGENGADDGISGANSAHGAIDYLQGVDRGDGYKFDWDEVDLRYSLEVYDANADFSDPNVKPVKDRMVKIVDSYEPVTFDLRLVPNREYRFVVFADFLYATEDENTYVLNNNDGNISDPTTSIEDQRYLGYWHTIGEDLRDITIVNDAINTEASDAYFAIENIEITNSAAKDIVLKRPYGKVRVIATDLAELNLNVNPKLVKVDYSTTIPTGFNAVTGEISKETANRSYVAVLNATKESLANHVYTDGYDAKKATNANGVERHTHMTLFTDYILAAEQTPYHFTMSVYEDLACQKPIKETVFNTDIPVERNKLTTVIGNVLTTATEINVTIDDNFADEYKREMVFVSSARELQEALKNYKEGQTILFEANIEGNVVINQKVGVNYLIEGNGYNYDGIIEINGDARQADADSVTLRNINFKTEKKGINVIDSNDNTKYGNNYNYAHNITIDGCTFELGEGSVALKMRQSKNVVIKNCKMTAGHSFAQFYGVNGVEVANTEVTGTKNGIAFGTSINCEVKESTFVVEGYGFRGEPGGDAIADAVKITADKPVIVRKLTAGNYNLTINNSELNSLMGYQVIFTNGDDEGQLVIPEGDFKFETDGDYLVFPSDVKIAYDAYSLQKAIDDAAKGETIYVAGKCNCEGIFLINKDINIKGFAGATITGKVGIIAGSDNTTFENIKFVVNDDTEKGAPNNQTNKSGIVVIYASAVGFKNCSFEGMTEAVYAIFNKDNNASEPVTIENCAFKGNRAIRTRANVKVDGCTFEGNTKPIVDVLGFGAADVNGYVQFTNNDAKVDAPVAGVMLKVSNHAFRHVEFNVGDNHEDINSIWRDADHTHANLANFTREFTNEVITINYEENEEYEVATANQLQLLLDNDNLNELQVEVTADIDNAGKRFEFNRDTKIDGGNHVIKGDTGSVGEYTFRVNNGNININNVNIVGGGVSIFGGSNVEFNGNSVYVDASNTSGRYAFFVRENSTLTINSGDFSWNTKKNDKRAYIYTYPGCTVYITGGNFGKASTRSGYTAGILGDGEVIITGGTFKFDPSAWVANGYEAVKNGETWTVSAK